MDIAVDHVQKMCTTHVGFIARNNVKISGKVRKNGGERSSN